MFSFGFFQDHENEPIEKSPLQNEENNIPDDNALTEEILKFLGDNPKISKAVEPNLHKDIFDRLEGWIADGLPKDDREKLIKKYSRPGYLEAPKLNPEVEPALQEAAVKRDKHFFRIPKYYWFGHYQRRLCIILNIICRR